VVVQVELDHVALADADERAGDAAAVGPEGVFDAVGQAAHDLEHLQVDDDARRILAVDRRRHVRRGGEDRLLHRHVQHLGREDDGPLEIGRALTGEAQRRGQCETGGEDAGGNFAVLVHGCVGLTKGIIGREKLFCSRVYSVRASRALTCIKWWVGWAWERD
jgi:hypothetical protein